MPEAGALRRGPAAGDVVAGLSVALAVIPQAVAYAALAGLDAQRGLYAAALPAIAAAWFASSRYLQTGPVAVTSLLVLGALAPLAPTGTAEYVKLAALLALIVGAARLAAGLLRTGVIAYLMSEPVLLAFTSAAALLIVASQVPAALGLAGDPTAVMVRAVEVLVHPSQWHATAGLLTAATVVLVLLARRVHPLVPGVLVAIAGGVLFSRLAGYDGPVLGAIGPVLPHLSLDLPWTRTADLLVPGLVIALVGFGEPAAISRALAARDRDRWDPNREFVSQGVANLVAGVVGAYPVGGSFSRSSLNRLAGARTRWSGAVTGLAVLAFLPAAGLIAPLPRAVLAGIVIAAVLPLMRFRSLAGMWRIARVQALVAYGTFVLTLVLSPHIEQAILLGILLAVAAHLYRELQPEVRAWAQGDVLHVAPRGVAFFGSIPAIEEAVLDALAGADGISTIVLHMGGLGRVDLTGALTLKQMIADLAQAGVTVRLEDVPNHSRKIIARCLDWAPPDAPAS